MRPAFSSTKQAAAFLLLLFLLVAAPWLAGKSLLPPREQAYSSEPWTWGAYPWIEKQIFDETNDIDIAFIGSSHIAFGIDTPFVQKKLDEQLGRKTVVRSICWGWAGYDALYFITRDLLAHRRIKTLVFLDETARSINPEAQHWFRFGDDAGELAGFPPKAKGIFYFASVMGMPRNLVELLAPNLPEGIDDPPLPNYYETQFHTVNPETILGSVNAKLGFDPVLGSNADFIPYIPQTGATPSDVCVYSPAMATNFSFSNEPLADWQTTLARRFSLLAKQNGCQLVLLHMPLLAERTSSVIAESHYWPDFLQADVTMLGIPPGRLFAGLTEKEVKQMFGDPMHLNQNGREYFTPLITPALLHLYESKPNH